MTNHSDMIVSFEGPDTVVPQRDSLVKVLDASGLWYELKEITYCCFYIDVRGYLDPESLNEIRNIDTCQLLIKDETSYYFSDERGQ